MTRGLISELDAQTIEATLRLILDEFNDDVINVTEVGLFNCFTSIGIYEYLKSNGRDVSFIGIDNEADKPIVKPDWMGFVKGNSIEVYNEVKDDSQHFIFIDSCHNFPMTIADFYCFEKKVKVGGYLAFHDTGNHIEQFYGFQRMGRTIDADMYIACRKALSRIGLYDGKKEGWKLIFDKADVTDAAGGVTVLKRIA